MNKIKRLSRGRSIHLLFAVLALGCLAYSGYQGLRLRHAARIDDAIVLLDGAPRALPDHTTNETTNETANKTANETASTAANRAASAVANKAASGTALGTAIGTANDTAHGKAQDRVKDEAKDQTNAMPASSTGTDDAPPVQLARAVALARAGATEDAAKLYGLLIRQDRDARTDAGRTARFDLGNLYLRAGLASRSADPSRSMPMIELAKQRYRDLLDLHPDDWDARYNLERALWAAPENGDESGNIASLQDIKRNALAPGMNAGDLP